MAKHKGTARESTRHSGRQFGAGYEFTRPTSFVVTLGPWKRLNYSGGAINHPDEVASADHMFIHPTGVIQPQKTSPTAWTITGDASFHGCGRFDIGGEMEGCIFGRRTTTDYVSFHHINDAGTETNFVSAVALAVGAHRILAVSWGGRLYVVSPGLTTGVYVYVDNTSFAVIGGSPANPEFVGVLSNNVFVVSRIGGVWTVSWCADSAPTDWTGVGSGTAPIPGTMGIPKGVVYLGETAVICCSEGAYRMIPTGTLPAFRFEPLPGFSGCVTRYDIACDGKTIIFAHTARATMAWRDGVQQPINNRSTTPGIYGTLVNDSSQNYHYSAVLGWFFVHDHAYSFDFSLAIDPNTLEYIGAGSAVNADLMMFDSAVTATSLGARGVVFNGETGVYTVLGSANSFNTVTDKSFQTGQLYFGRPVRLDRVLVVNDKQGEVLPVLTVDLSYITLEGNTVASGLILTRTYASNNNTLLVFLAGIEAELFALLVSVYDQAVHQINLYFTDPAGELTGWIKLP